MVKSCVLMVVKLDEVDEDDDDDVLTALDGTTPAVRELERKKRKLINEVSDHFCF